MIEELLEHPENGGEVVILVPTANKAAVEGLAAFYERDSPNLTVGTGTTRLTGNLASPVPGDVFGYHSSGAWLVHWRALPDNYLIGVTTEGEKPLAMRQHAEPELQGFNLVANRDDHPWYERQWARFAGFGAWNRVGAVVQEVGDASYDIPTNYNTPPY
jgi:hypothetical protein